MTDYSFQAMATVTCGTKRATLTGGYSTNLTGLKCLPLAPVDAETRQRLQLNTPHILLETFLQDAPDIRAGDKLVISAIEYPVKTVEPWTWLPTSDTRLHLILEDLRNL